MRLQRTKEFQFEVFLSLKGPAGPSVNRIKAGSPPALKNEENRLLPLLHINADISRKIDCAERRVQADSEEQ